MKKDENFNGVRKNAGVCSELTFTTVIFHAKLSKLKNMYTMGTTKPSPTLR